MQKKLVQSSLALTAAAALGLGSAFVASPAVADNGPQMLDVQNDAQVQKALTSVGDINAYGVRGNELNIGVSDPESDSAEAFSDKYENVNIVEAAGDIEPYAGNDVVGGAGYLSDIPSMPKYSAACSTGFAGWDASGNQIILTAGHCAEDIDEETNATTGKVVLKDTEKPSSAPANGGETGYEPKGIGPLGDWGFTKYGSDVLEEPAGPDDEPDWPEPKADDIDFAVINVDESKYNVKNGIADWSKESADADDLSTSVSAIKNVGAHSEGTVKKSGRTTGLTEGDVFADYNEQFDFQNVGGRWVHGFAVLSDPASPFSQPGDSGGGVFQGDTAVGVISGGGPYKDQALGWVADLDYSLDAAGIEFHATKPDDGGGDDADADAGADGKDADAAAAADGEDADADAGADGKDADADGEDADADAGADSKDANADADTPEAPEAPKAEDQTVDVNGLITGQTEPNAEVKLSWNPVEDTGTQSEIRAQAAAADSTTVTADDSGKFTAEAPAEAGEYDYTATTVVDGVESDATEFTVTVEEAADEAEAAAAADGDSADADSGADSADANAEADADGSDSDAGATADAKNAESNADSDGSKDGEAPAERTISIEPKEVAASDFVKKDKGVQITVEGFEEGENVSLEVVAGPENVEGITLDETANEDGVAAFSIYGTNASDPSAYLGKYDVQVTGANDTDDEKALTGSFSVVADEDGNGGGNGGGDDGDGGDGGSDLPRTGAELTGLAAGAGLLVVGGAAVVLTVRRNKKN